MAYLMGDGVYNVISCFFCNAHQNLAVESEAKYLTDVI